MFGRFRIEHLDGSCFPVQPLCIPIEHIGAGAAKQCTGIHGSIFLQNVDHIRKGCANVLIGSAVCADEDHSSVGALADGRPGTVAGMINVHRVSVDNQDRAAGAAVPNFKLQCLLLCHGVGNDQNIIPVEANKACIRRHYRKIVPYHLSLGKVQSQRNAANFQTSGAVVPACSRVDCGDGSFFFDCIIHFQSRSVLGKRLGGGGQIQP